MNNGKNSTWNRLRRTLHTYRLESGLVNPVRDWFLGLVGAGLVFVGAVSYVGYALWNEYQFGDTVPEVTETEIRYRASDVDFFLAAQRDRAARYEALRAQSYLPPSARPSEPALVEDAESMSPEAEPVSVPTTTESGADVPEDTSLPLTVE
jgi:hypothetical protein